MRTVGGAAPIRIVRVIGRLNIGGPAIQAITLSERLNAFGYETLLVRGTEGPREGSMDALAAELGIQPHMVRALRRELGLHDLFALRHLVGILRSSEADVLHTHAAKAGALGRLAAILAGPRAPKVRVHTFHGHVLTGYFSERKAKMFRRIEDALARSTTRLIAVSEEVREDLLRLGVGQPGQIEVVELGLDLSKFMLSGAERAARRSETRTRLGLEPEDRVVTLVARLVPIKRVDRFLQVASLLAAIPGIRFLVVGDGELADELKASDPARRLTSKLVWGGFQDDMAGVMCASDVVALTSDNEGTPVSLIEAQAAGVPVVSTRVGGVASAVSDGGSGRLVSAGADAAFASAVRELLEDPELRAKYGEFGRELVLTRFSLERLSRDIDDLYRRLLVVR